MPNFSSKRRAHHSAPQMFDLVADVERYPEFVPLCQQLKVRQRTSRPDGTEIVICGMIVIGVAGFITDRLVLLLGRRLLRWSPGHG